MEFVRGEMIINQQFNLSKSYKTKFLRLMFKIELQSNVSYNYLYYSSKLLKIEDLYKLEIAKFKYLYEHNKLPPLFSAGVGNLLHLKSQISPFVTIRYPAGAAKLPIGPKTSVIPQMSLEKRSLFISQRSHNWGFKKPHVVLEPQVADPWFSDYFLPLKKIHRHNTRSSSSNKYFLPFFSTNKAQTIHQSKNLENARFT